MAASRRHSTDYQQISGYVSKEIALKFKATCVERETSISEVLEDLIRKWLVEQGKPAASDKGK